VKKRNIYISVFVTSVEMNLEKEFTNDTLVNKLLKPKHHEKIECILNEELKEFKTIRELKKTKQITTGKNVSKKELSEIATKTFNDVNNFFEINNESFPKIEQFSLLQKEKRHILAKYFTSNILIFSSAYLNATEMSNWAIPLIPASMMLFYAVRDHIERPTATYKKTKNQEKITLSKFKKTNLVPIIAHEYTHHIQNLNNYLRYDLGIFIEGQARITDKHVANKYTIKENNKAYLYKVLNRSVHELMSTYVWMSKELNKQPNPQLTADPIFEYSDDIQYLSDNKIPSVHALGNAYMSTHPQDQKIMKFIK
ncbi:MAG: hypothetical protein ACOC1P_00960, partial [Minisyncoccales bacterium]